MEARSTAQWIVAILVIVVGYCFPVFADTVYIYSDDFDLSIPAVPGDTRGWMADAIINITDNLVIHDLDVGITATHTSAFDLQIYLQSPAGTQLTLNMYNFDEFFEGGNYTNTIFDDEAAIPIEDAAPPFTGRFRPKAGSLLSIFDNQNVNGVWRLRIYDAYYNDTGTLERFELIVSTPEPATAILLTLGTCLATLFRPRRGR
jgi:hypothetical protein